jgi:hypothetical protein
MNIATYVHKYITRQFQDWCQDSWVSRDLVEMVCYCY